MSQGMSAAEIILSVFMGVLTLVSTFGIPWAFRISNKLTAIDTKLSNGLTSKVSEYGDRIHNIELTCAKNHSEE